MTSEFDPRIDAVLALVAESAQTDGASALDEATLLTLRHHPERARYWLEEDRAVAVLVGDEVGLVVHPDWRGRGLGTELASRVLAEAGELSIKAWVHGVSPGAERLAERFGLVPVRSLWVMRRPSWNGRSPVVSGDLVIRRFQPGDETELLRVNASAFAEHPEQGALDAAGLAERMAEPWFDPEGLILAFDRTGSTLQGFHWTKVHENGDGEVYVLGVQPSSQGAGLGRILLVAGMEHLAERGANGVLLYVEADNAPAIALYEKYGFTHAAADSHTQYARR